MLALLLAWAQGGVPEVDEPSGYARAWQQGRAAAAARRGAAGANGDTGEATGAHPGLGAAEGGPGGAGRTGPEAKRRAAAARRSQQRAGRVAAGVAELQMVADGPGQ